MSFVYHQLMRRILMRFFLWSLCLASLFFGEQALAQSYANTSITYNWIDPSTHTKVGYSTVAYPGAIAFRQSAGCQTTPPILDDTLSDPIPIGFTFAFAGVPFTDLRIMTNGRLQFNNNTQCEYGSPVQQRPYPDAGLNYTMRIYGNDLDHTLKSDTPGSTYNTPCIDRNVCYISYATLGTAPTRQFVVTWNNVPEWTTGANPQGAYSLQVILQENGEFIYQYGSVTAGPSAALGQVGWQVGINDYQTVATGFPASNTALKFYFPRPVVEYRMEQPSWTSAAGQVLDTSGNGRNGTALGGVQTFTPGKVCRAANFPGNTNAAPIAAIDSGISIPTTVGSAGMITFWYRSNTAWTGADAQLVDATTVNGQWFYATRRSDGKIYFVVTDSSGTVRTATTAAITVAANTWKHISLSWSFNALGATNSDHLRIYVDGVQQIESAFTTAATISTQIDTLYIGDNRSAVTGTNGTVNSANGAIDEFRMYNYEGGVALAQRDSSTFYSGCLNHYAISYGSNVPSASTPGTGVTCAQTQVTITAHDSTNATVIMPNNTTQITLSTANGLGDWVLVSGYGVLNNGTANDGVATYIFNGEYQAIFALTYTTAATVNINVSDGQFVEQEDPALTITACVAARFNACENPVAPSVTRCTPTTGSTTYAQLNTKLANTAFALDIVKLQTNGTLETTFTNTATVSLVANSTLGVPLDAFNCPTSQTATIPLGTISFTAGRPAVGGVAIAANAFSNVAPNYSAYRDVRLKVTCTASACGTALTACSTDNFAIRPTNFSVSSNMTNTAQTGTPKLNAGANFTLTTTATPGYAGTPLIDNSVLGAKVYSHNNLADNPTALTSTAAISPIPVAASTIATGVATNSTMNYNDVGNFKIIADGIYDNSFTSVDQAQGGCIANSSSNTAAAVTGLFGCNIGNQATTALFGRFYPDHYALNTTLGGYCSGFTYMDQTEIPISLSATALSTGNVVLLNYKTGYATVATIAVTGDNGGSAVSLSRLSPALPNYTWAAGTTGRSYSTNATGYAAGATSITISGYGTISNGDVVKFGADNNRYTVSSYSAGTLVISPGLINAIPAAATSVNFIAGFAKLTGPVVIDGPYDSFALKTTITDSDGAGITSVNGSTVASTATVTSGTTKIRYGRMRVENAYGSELIALPVKVVAQYWNGSYFVTNTLDSCSAIAKSNFSINGQSGGITATNMTTAGNVPLNTGVTLTGGLGTIRILPPSPTISTKGVFNLNYNSPITAPFSLPYLSGTGRETMGLYKNGPVIFIREVH